MGAQLRHVCEVFGVEELLTPDDAYEKGWDYPPRMGGLRRRLTAHLPALPAHRHPVVLAGRRQVEPRHAQLRAARHP